MAVRLLKELKALGVQLSIDDFGTGYSSLGYLHRFPVNTLKIDRSFVGRIGEAAENIEIVRTIVSLAENMGMEVVAEGVETLSQLTQLRKLNCKYGQGYLFSRPVDADSVTAWIARKPHWQEGFFDHLLRSQESYLEKWEYVRMNPVRAKLCDMPDAWPFQGEIVRIPFN